MTEYNFPVPATTSETPAQARSSHGLRGRRTRHARNHSEHRDTDSQGSNSSLQGVSIEKGKSEYISGVDPCLPHSQFNANIDRPLSLGGHVESQENEKLCFCAASLALNSRMGEACSGRLISYFSVHHFTFLGGKGSIRTGRVL